MKRSIDFKSNCYIFLRQNLQTKQYKASRVTPTNRTTEKPRAHEKFNQRKRARKYTHDFKYSFCQWRIYIILCARHNQNHVAAKEFKTRFNLVLKLLKYRNYWKSYGCFNVGLFSRLAEISDCFGGR